MSFSDSVYLPGLPHTFQSLKDVSAAPYVADSIIKVNGSATGLEEVPASSIILPAVGSGLTNDIPVFSGVAPPVLSDSGVSIDTVFGQKVMKPSNPLQPLKIQSDSSTVTIDAPTSSIFLNADTTTGNINLTSASSQLICYNNISLSANGGLTLQAGMGAQIKINNDGSIEVTAASGFPLTISCNGGTSQWKFDGTATGNYVMPLTNGLNGSVLTNDGSGNLSWVGGA